VQRAAFPSSAWCHPGAAHRAITYWTTVGDTVAVSGAKWKLQQLKYGLTGKIPDGLLFRISSIQADDAKAYQTQDAFARDMLKAMSPEGRQRIIAIRRSQLIR